MIITPKIKNELDDEVRLTELREYLSGLSLEEHQRIVNLLKADLQERQPSPTPVIVADKTMWDAYDYFIEKHRREDREAIEAEIEAERIAKLQLQFTDWSQSDT